jgi:hypothetical protein
LVRVAERLGFAFRRQRGSIQDLKITVEEFANLL